MLAGEPGWQSVSKAVVAVESILEEQGRERWMVVQGVWLVPTLGTVFLEQTLKGVAKGVLDRGFCREQVCSPMA